MSGKPASSMPVRGAALVEQRLGYEFRQRALFDRALTHRSFGADHNERLEFLGDAVLSLAVSRLLFDRFSGSDEGDLTRVRAHLVREDSLHRVALALGLPEALRLSEGEARGGGATRPSILADAVEALIGAVSIDGGFEAAQALVTRLFGETIMSTTADNWRKDAKTELQEWLQARHVPVPSYRIAATRGQAHAQTFEVECEVPSLDWRATGAGRSRRHAEQASAQQMLDRIKAGDLVVPARKGNPSA
jgi:ribonuclease-3